MANVRAIPAVAAGFGAAVLFAALQSPAVGQELGSITGIVTDERSGEPLAGATVALLGLGVEAVTGGDGQFLFQRVPVGAVEVRFEAPSYMSVVEEIELSAAVMLRVRLVRLAAVLDEVLVIAGLAPPTTGSTEVALRTDEAPWRSILDLLEDQVPGVIVRRSGGLGTGAYLYMRGAGSLQLDNAPDIYLDGVKLDGGNPGRQSIHVLDLIPAHEVARVQVLKGAAAVTTGALSGANGVVLIETHRRGASERARN